MKRALVVFAAAVISTAAMAEDGSPAIGTGLRSGPIVGGNSTFLGGGNSSGYTGSGVRSPYLGPSGSRVEAQDAGGYVGGGFRNPFLGGGSGRVEGEDEDSPMLGGGGSRSGLLTGSNSAGTFGSGPRTIITGVHRIR